MGVLPLPPGWRSYVWSGLVGVDGFIKTSGLPLLSDGRIVAGLKSCNVFNAETTKYQPWFPPCQSKAVWSDISQLPVGLTSPQFRFHSGCEPRWLLGFRVRSLERTEFRLSLLQPEAHVHLTVERRGGR
jgi:hypothetical protein